MFGPTPGCVISNCACGCSSAALLAPLHPACRSAGPTSPAARSKSSRRHAAQGLRRKFAQQLLSRLAPQLALALHSLIQRKVLQFVFHPAANLHQLVPMQHQLPQIALLPVRSPQPRKPAFHHQLQNVRCIPFVRLLLAHVTGPDLRRISDPDLVPQILPPVRRTTGCCPWLPCRSAPAPPVADKTPWRRPWHAPVSARPVSPVSVSSHAICCQLGWKSHPIIIMRRLLPSQRLCPQTKTTGFESSLRSYPINPCVLCKGGRRCCVCYLISLWRRDQTQVAQHFRLSPSAENAKDEAPHCFRDASEIVGGVSQNQA